MRDGGYETCLVGKMHFNGDRQFNGFQHRPYGDLTGHGIQQPGHQPDPIHHDDLDVQPRRQAIERGTRIPNAGVTQIPESLLQEQVVVRESIGWLREHRARRNRPWFLTVSFSRSHFPLTAPRRHFSRYWDLEADEPTDRLTSPPVDTENEFEHPWVERQQQRYEQFTDTELKRARAGYFACVDFLDEVIGELLRTLEAEGFLDNTIITYTSDHGDMAGEHGLWWKSTFHEGSTRVPWFVQLPAHRSGDRDPGVIETPVSLIGVFPILCGLTSLDAPASVEGEDLSDAVRTGTEPDRGPVVCDNIGLYRLVCDGRYKYVRFQDYPELLFDLEADPHETQNLLSGAIERDVEPLDRLRTFVDETIDFEAVKERQQETQIEAEHRALPIPPGTGNAYLMPDGRLIDAGTPLYKPDVLADAPDSVFLDWPAEDDTDADT